MKAIVVMFDSLNRHMLPPYGCDWVHAPNFERLAQKTVTFKNSYIGSMPCMPARRELHTGRYNFLHRSWSPLEPFDDSMPEMLREHGVYSHLVTDHYHYWEDGGATYHNRYNSYEFVRGQEGDLWKGQVQAPQLPEDILLPAGKSLRVLQQDWVNRAQASVLEDFPQHGVFSLGLEFMDANRAADRWLLQIEAFDPHEPFFTHQKYKDLYPHDYTGPHFDWPPYARVNEPPELVQHLRYEYAALVSLCDEQLGRVLDRMDELDLWDDTMLIVCTDHGLLLGEHDWWTKNIMPWYNHIANTPLFIWDPRSRAQGENRESLVQMIDIPATLLEYFGVARPKAMQGQPLRETIASDRPVHQAALFGIHGGHINCTDGRYVYMRAPVNRDNQPLFEYTLMPMHLRARFSAEELQRAELVPPFNFTCDCPLLKIPVRGWSVPHEFGTLLFDLQDDPQQQNPLQDYAVEGMMIRHLIRLMKDTDAPLEQFERLGLRVYTDGPTSS